jgi:hypothetical protein
MFVCTLDAAFVFSAKLDHVIEFMTSEALRDVTVLLEQFALALVICIQHAHVHQLIYHRFDRNLYDER